MEILRLMFIGFVVGIANLIPGISGGTMTVVFGIYDSVISLISLNIKKIILRWNFWLPLSLGIAAGILLFSKLINRFSELYPTASLWFFTGIILGTLPFIALQTHKKACMTKSTNEPKKQSVCRYLSVCAAFVAALALMLYIKYTNGENFAQTTQSTVKPALWIKLCISSAVAAAGMIVPGISGSFLMLIFGTYNIVIRALSDFNINVLVPVAMGALAGLLGGASLIRLLLKKVPAQTYGAILGLVVGSVAIMYRGMPEKNEMLLSVGLCIAGLGASYASGCRKKTKMT